MMIATQLGIQNTDASCTAGRYRQRYIVGTSWCEYKFAESDHSIVTNLALRSHISTLHKAPP
jgi:hypothetical protein